MPWERAGHSFQGVLVSHPVQMLYHPGVEVWYDHKTPIIELDEDLQLLGPVLMPMSVHMAQAIVGKEGHFCRDLLKGSQVCTVDH
jgi:hypothetical protein